MPANTNYGTGRRKTSTARVHLRPGTGKIRINDRTIEEFFGRQTCPHDRAPAARDGADGRPLRRRSERCRRRQHRPGRRDPPRPHARADGLRRVAAQAVAQWPVSSRAMRAKSSARRSACARPVAARSSRSVNSLGGSSSGRTTDSDSVNLGSNPSPPATNLKARASGPSRLWLREQDREPREPRVRQASRSRSLIQRTLHRIRTLAHHMRVDLRRLHILVSEQFLHGAMS